ncbi:MAG: tRNA (5-methylaminomethyl-2-thiouridine)(34)-methyltransferase MnmD [Mucinivorans sp.]
MILTTDDGSQTLRHELFGELYHSSRGAVGEAMHVYVSPLEAYYQTVQRPLRVFEVGFGSGLNALLTLQTKLNVDYHTIEFYPISMSTARGLQYSIQDYFLELHQAPWGVRTQISENFSLTKYNDDLELFDFTSLTSSVDVIFFDAFAPDSQPTLWGERIMQSMNHLLVDGGILTTYCSKGVVKEALRASYFDVKRCEGALGKRHMLIATKQ